MPVLHRINPARLSVMLGVFLLLLGVVCWRLYTLGWRRHTLYLETSQAQADGVSNILLRGNIYLTDAEGREYLVATNKKFPVLFLTPSKFAPERRDESIVALSRVTGLTVDAIRATADSGLSGARVLLKKLSDEQVKELTELKLPGITIGYETDRAYPAGTLAADAIGFLGYAESGRSGQYGVEASYEDQLTGRPIRSSAVHWDIKGQILKLFGKDAPSSQGGEGPGEIVLTLDKNIQSYAQEVLDGVLRKYHAASGTLIVQEPATGRIMALADSPTYDPNAYGSAPTASFLNGALLPFEPGSSLKPFTMAVGIQNGVITPDTTFDDEGDVIIDGFNIKNFNEQHFGRVTMTRVLEKSINTGVMWVAQKVGNGAFREFIVNMGFGQRTGIDLPGESSGDLSNLYRDKRIYIMTASFGQGLTVTPMQLITGYSAIANGGRLMKPYIVDSVRDDHGAVTKHEPEMVGTPFTSRTAASLRAMLTSVVDNGFDKARIARYDVAGKTGTAQIASPDGGYLENVYNHSFVGFAPASDPKFVILIKMERPQGVTFAADSLSPAFRDMALFLLNYLKIPPTR